MFNRKSFGGKRTSGSDSSGEQEELSQTMLEILLELTEDTSNLKEAVVDQLGLREVTHGTRDMNAAWDVVKKKAARTYSRRFSLDRRKELVWTDKLADPPRAGLDKRISARNMKKLNELANAEGCTVDQMIERLTLAYTPSRNPDER